MPNLVNLDDVSGDPVGSTEWLSLEVEYAGEDARLIRAAARRSGQAYDDAVRSLSCAAAAGTLAGPRHLVLFVLVGLLGLVLGLVAPSLAHALRSVAAVRFAL